MTFAFSELKKIIFFLFSVSNYNFYYANIIHMQSIFDVFLCLIERNMVELIYTFKFWLYVANYIKQITNTVHVDFSLNFIFTCNKI